MMVILKMVLILKMDLKKHIIKTENNLRLLDNLKNHIRKAENIWLASDLDREGAAIAGILKMNLN